MMDSLETTETTAPVQSSEPVIEKTNEAPEAPVEENVECAPITADAAPVEETTEPQPATEETAEQVPATKEEVVARMKELASGEELGEKTELDQLKVLFYKYHNAEIQAAHRAFIEAGGEAEKFVMRCGFQPVMLQKWTDARLLTSVKAGERQNAPTFYSLAEIKGVIASVKLKSMCNQ